MSVSKRIIEQIAQYFCNLLFVDRHDTGIYSIRDYQPLSRTGYRGLETGQRLFKQHHDILLRIAQAHAVALYLPEIEQLIDEREQAFGVLLYHFEPFLRLGRQVQGDNGFERALYKRERRLYFMGDRCEELYLCAVQLFLFPHFQ